MKSMHVRCVLLASAALLLGACRSAPPVASGDAAVAASGTLGLPDKVLIQKGIYVPGAVREECGLEVRVADYVKHYTQGYDKVPLAKAGQGKALEMEITVLLATPGGGFSGMKVVTVEGTLREGGKITGTFIATRHSGGRSPFGGGGTCNILDLCAEAIGKDIATWLRKPTMKAKLGDAI